MKQISVQETAQMLLQCESAYILIHRSPDGDCIGAGYALAYALRSLGKKARVLCSDPIPQRYHFMMPEAETLEEFQPEQILSVDVADEKLLGDGLSAYQGKVDLCIDHHISNTGYAKALCLDGKAAAACQVIYEVFCAMSLTMTREIAACLYTGMATDTGCFLYDNVGPRTLRIVAELMEAHPEIPYSMINRNMFVVKSMGRLKLDQLLIDHLESYLDGQCMLICITQEMIQQYAVDEAALEGIAGFPLQVEGAQVGVVLKEREKGIFRVSMRSADWVNVSAICQTLGGGGHKKAAGCTVQGTPEEARKLLVDAVTKGMAKR